MSTITAQEQAWKGQMGNDYHKRSPGDVEANVAFFRRVFPIPHDALQRQWRDINTILELGAGTGANVKALRKRFPNAHATAVELNRAACTMLQADSPEVKAIEASILDWEPQQRWDLVLTKGLLIHIAPNLLPAVYATLHKAAARYILIAEYYNPTPVEVVYRGEKDLLWKRDFAGELLDRYTDLQLIGYGFVYHRDKHPQDDLTYFLLEKRADIARAAA